MPLLRSGVLPQAPSCPVRGELISELRLCQERSGLTFRDSFQQFSGRTSVRGGPCFSQAVLLYNHNCRKGSHTKSVVEWCFGLPAD